MTTETGLDFSKAYKTLTLFQIGPSMRRRDDIPVGTIGARFELDWDVSPLFPYLNAILPDAQWYETPDYIKFTLTGRLCAFYPRVGAFSPVKNLDRAMAFLDELVPFISDINRRKASLIPDHRKFKPVSAIDVFQLLPRTNCQACGHLTCLAFAAAVSRKKASPADCPHLGRPVEEKALFPVCDANGVLIRTVALDIDSTTLRERISEKESQIDKLQSRLQRYLQDQTVAVDEVNRKPFDTLTPREIDVLRLVAAGLTNKEVSGQLHISEHTVKSHLIHIFDKIDVNDRTQASVWAASQGLLRKKGIVEG